MYSCDGILEYESVFNDWNKGSNFFSALTVALALKWVRDVKKIFSCVYFDLTSFRKGYFGSLYKFDDKTTIQRTKTLSTYESAESALLDELLTLLERKE
jgi:hypothetical protein